MARDGFSVFDSNFCRIVHPQVIDPDRSVDQNHFLAARRRRGAESLGSLPPSRAKRRAASRSINAFNASRTSADFAFSPV
jgi:hypothetical protein